MFFIGKYYFKRILNIHFLLFSLYFIRTDIKIRLEILKIIEKIFHRLPSSIVNDDHLIPGQSFLFASLEFLIAILLNYYPNIAGDTQLSSIIQMKLNEDDAKDFQIVELISSTIKLLYELVKLCSTNENKIIPIILHLLLSISFALLSTKSDQQKSLLSIIIQLIENIFNTSINETISNRAMITIMNLRTNRKFIS
jgi:hypothetical protein